MFVIYSTDQALKVLLSFFGSHPCFPRDYSKTATWSFIRTHLVEKEWGRWGPRRGESVERHNLEAFTLHPISGFFESYAQIWHLCKVMKLHLIKKRHLKQYNVIAQNIFLAASVGYQNRGSPIFYYYALILQWSHTPHNFLTLTLQIFFFFFSTGLLNTMESARSPQLSPITGSDQNYLHACLLELWREWERERGRERVGGGIWLTPSDLRKHPLNRRLIRNDRHRRSCVCRNLSAALHLGTLPCVGESLLSKKLVYELVNQTKYSTNHFTHFTLLIKLGNTAVPFIHK